MVHRGPDDEGVYVDEAVGMGVRRLAILDVEGGHQPILSEDGTKVVILNGEIYNYVELREKLIARGHRFTTRTDTEVLVHLYEEKGEACIEDLNGMFAFAVWDAEARRLFLARDRLGIKPLHYAVAGGMLLFASEINALLANPEVDRTLEPTAVADYLTYFYLPGTSSIYRGVRKVPPAHYMVWENGRSRQSRYWDIRYTPPAKPPPIEHYAEAYREHLKRSVRLQLRSDVPLGVFLSGGLDSGSLVAAIHRVTDQPIQTFTIGFDSPSYDESQYAEATAVQYGTEHHAYRITADDMERSADLVSYFGEPFGPFTLVQVYMLCRWSRDHIKVALAGDGGDELFGGYQTYVATRLAQPYLRLPPRLRRAVFGRLARLLPVSDRLLSLDFKVREFIRGAEMFERAGNLAWKVLFNDTERASVLAPEFLEHVSNHDVFTAARRCQQPPESATDLQRALYGDLTMFLPDSVLLQTDRMSMAASQEVRVPLLDHELVEFAATVPDAYKLRGKRTKILVRHAMADWLPRKVIHKPKTGFTTPIPIWIRGPLRPFVTDILSEAALKRTGLFNPPCVQQLVREHLEGRANHARRIWALVHFMLWHEQCYARSPVTREEQGRHAG